MSKLTINNKADLAKLKKKMQKRIADALDVPIRKTAIINVPNTGKITRVVVNGEEMPIAEPIPIKQGENVHDAIRNHLGGQSRKKKTDEYQGRHSKRD